MRVSRRHAALFVLAAASRPAAAAAEEKKDEPAPLTQEEVEAWLESSALEADVTVRDVPEAPPHPPRHHGFVLETALGALGHAGEMRHVSPAAPWFHVAFGWEPTRWIMLLALGDVAFGNTSLASRPPEPRAYALFAGGGGVRFTWEPADWCGLWLQGEMGAATVNSDVLATYGFNDASGLSPFFGGTLGFEWYQISPHYALVARGTVRDYSQLLHRQLGSGPPLAWIGSAGLQYTF